MGGCATHHYWSPVCYCQCVTGLVWVGVRHITIGPQCVTVSVLRAWCGWVCDTSLLVSSVLLSVCYRPGVGGCATHHYWSPVCYCQCVTGLVWVGVRHITIGLQCVTVSVLQAWCGWVCDTSLLVSSVLLSVCYGPGVGGCATHHYWSPVCYCQCVTGLVWVGVQHITIGLQCVTVCFAAGEVQCSTCGRQPVESAPGTRYCEPQITGDPTCSHEHNN